MAVVGALRWTTCLLMAALTGGCVTAREREAVPEAALVHSYLSDKPAELHRHFYVTLAQGPRNRTLNHMRLGLASFAMGNRDRLAAELFDDALAGIEAVHADTPETRKAQGLMTGERIKDFKGEPYERVMAYYYRGLLYLRDGDYDNARASFKGGMLQDALAEEEQYRADFALMPFLQGWAAHCAGKDALAAEDYREFKDFNKDAPLPGGTDNVLVLVETGGAPVKVSDGPRLRLRRTAGTGSARIVWNDPDRPGRPGNGGQALLLEDIFHQASTRGGRPFDAILEGKAEFKSTADTVGDAALVGAVVAANVATSGGSPYGRKTRQQRENENDARAAAAMVAGGLAVIGLLSKAFASTIEAQADIRYWDNLSDRVLGLTLTLPDGVKTLGVEFLSPGGNVLRQDRVAIQRAGRCGLAWIRDGAATLPRNPRAPNSVPADIMATPVTIPPPVVLVTTSPPRETKESPP
ncbi:hypothetical protein [Magnetospirillum sp. SS-4]|uniref:hypothetical protein n=1 Tax=Magnetospirillum sp. SS-4 TaxID=2681465 RepID=UPI00138421A6|nr:hypothetical protein [Magnetospirillum sp. SS-4]CAA7626320.1 conserved hypothetical protein [Magnetospirillum sp. SS-4]